MQQEYMVLNEIGPAWELKWSEVDSVVKYLVKSAMAESANCRRTVLQILVRCIPTNKGEPIKNLVDKFFLKNHPDHYLLSRVSILTQLAIHLLCIFSHMYYKFSPGFFRKDLA
jgi:hypothetical protein